MKYIDTEKLEAKIQKEYLNAKKKARYAADSGTPSDYSKRDAIVREYEYILRIIASLQQEQPKVDLEKEIDKFYGMYRKNGKTFLLEDNEECVDWKIDCNPEFEKSFAKYFFELGLKVQKGE